jgi:acyl-CoA thioester hydrolase
MTTGRTVETRLRVRYSETDRMGIVYHGHYISWFEIGRTEYCRAAGVPYRRLEDSGLWILVTVVECRYRRSARYDDEVRVATSLSELASRGLAFAYEVFDAEGRRLAEGATRHVFADAGGKPVRAPADVVETLERFRTRSVSE